MSDTLQEAQEAIEESEGFQTPNLQEFTFEAEEISDEPVESSLSEQSALSEIQLLELSDSEGSLLFYPRREGSELGVNLEVGDVLFLRERESNNEQENGVIVQVISKETASYPHADTKAIFRLMVRIKAFEHQRFNNEPKEVIDEFLVANFKVRASIKDGKWGLPAGKVVTRSIDTFILSENILTNQIFKKVGNHNLHLGEYKSAKVEFFGGGFEKINLITGMKGGGKSHIAKGIISESLKTGMSAVVFDINNEYKGLPQSKSYILGQNILDGLNTGLNLKFRLDRLPTNTIIELINRLSSIGEKTAIIVRAKLHETLQLRINKGICPDLPYLIESVSNIIEGNDRNEAIVNMRMSYITALNILGLYKLLMTKEEAKAEDEYIRKRENNEEATCPHVVSLRTALYEIQNDKPGVIIFEIGGLSSLIQITVVDLVMETLKNICQKETSRYKKAIGENKIHVPMYPTVYFEEAHMYMEIQKINELLPLIRHFGMNVFFMTNTPGALPDSVFRLIDNLVMTRILNKKDIDQVKNCGLTDADTIEGFAKSLDKYYALLLSSQDSSTKNFPLVFKVRPFKELPESGETRSMWKVFEDIANQKGAEQKDEDSQQIGE